MIRTIGRGNLASTLLIFSSILFVPGGSAPASESPSRFESIYDEFKGELPDTLASAPISDFRFTRDRAFFALDAGTIYLAPPIDGRHCMILFEGTGTFQFAPPTEVEKIQLTRFEKRPYLDETVERFVFFFGDHALEQLTARFDLSDSRTPKEIRKLHERARKLAVDIEEDDDTHSLPRGVAQLLLDGSHDEYFFAYVERDHGSPLVFEMTPFEDEEIRLLRRTRVSGERDHLELINMFHKLSDYEMGRQDQYGFAKLLDITHYDLQVEIEKSLDTTVRAAITVEPVEQDLEWIRLHLDHRFEIDAVRWGDTEASFHREDKSNLLWVRADSTVRNTPSSTLNLEYSGDPLKRTGDWIFLRGSIGWYPRATHQLNLATFDLAYEVYSGFDFVSAGRQTHIETSDDRTRYRYEIDRPSRNASFTLGYFNALDLDEEGIPPVRVYMAKSGHRAVGEALIEQGVQSGSNMHERVGADVVNSLAFFQRIFGPCEAERLVAAEISESHGEAFPGMLNLYWGTFQIEDVNAALFRAHEVAHQWWGHGVDYQSYHDQWLSEGLATFSSLVYLENALHDEDAYYNVLEEWRDDLFKVGKLDDDTEREISPIWLGGRTRKRASISEYMLTVYYKGAWVLHMLRQMMFDFEKESDAAFVAMLRDFYTTYEQKQASTNQFMEMVEQHTGTEMGWFFDQWVMKTALPRYDYSYKTSLVENDRYKVTMRVEQSEVPEQFRAYIPLRIEFDDEQFTILRVLIAGRHSEFDLPTFPMKPKKILFNYKDAVLCRHDDKKWRD